MVHLGKERGNLSLSLFLNHHLLHSLSSLVCRCHFFKGIIEQDMVKGLVVEHTMGPTPIDSFAISVFF